MNNFPVLERFSKLDYRQHVLTFASFGLPIVDLGSGDARLSHWLLQQRPDASIYCVDPDAGCYAKEGSPVLIQPHAANAAELVEKHPELVGNCAMAIIRPQPPRPGFQCYDLDGWQLLRPKVVLVLYCADGGDGSPELHSWLHRNGCPSFSLARDEVDFDGLPNYYSRTVKFTAQCEAPVMIRVSTCSLLIQADVDGLAFPDDLPEDEQNPNAPSDAQVVELLNQSLFATMLMTLGGRRQEAAGGVGEAEADGQECTLQ